MDTNTYHHSNGDYRPIEGQSGGRTLTTDEGLDCNGRPVLPVTERSA